MCVCGGGGGCEEGRGRKSELMVFRKSEEEGTFKFIQQIESFEMLPSQLLLEMSS